MGAADRGRDRRSRDRRRDDRGRRRSRSRDKDRRDRDRDRDRRDRERDRDRDRRDRDRTPRRASPDAGAKQPEKEEKKEQQPAAQTPTPTPTPPPPPQPETAQAPAPAAAAPPTPTPTPPPPPPPLPPGEKKDEAKPPVKPTPPSEPPPSGPPPPPPKATAKMISGGQLVLKSTARCIQPVANAGVGDQMLSNQYTAAQQLAIAAGLRDKTWFHCDDCGQDKPREEFSNNQIFGTRGGAGLGEQRAVRCRECVDRRMLEIQEQHRAQKAAKHKIKAEDYNVELYCKLCELQLGTYTEKEEHLISQEHLENKAWYQNNPAATYAAGLMNEPELEMQHMLPENMLKTQLEQMRKKLAMTNPIAAAALAAEQAAKAQQGALIAMKNAANEDVKVDTTPPPLPSAKEMLRERQEESTAKDDLNDRLKKMECPEIGMYDCPVELNTEEDGLPPNVTYRCTANFAGKEGGPAGLSVISTARATRTGAEAQACLMILRSIREHYGETVHTTVIGAPGQPPSPAPAVNPLDVVPSAAVAKVELTAPIAVTSTLPNPGLQAASEEAVVDAAVAEAAAKLAEEEAKAKAEKEAKAGLNAAAAHAVADGALPTGITNPLTPDTPPPEAAAPAAAAGAAPTAPAPAGDAAAAQAAAPGAMMPGMMPGMMPMGFGMPMMPGMMPGMAMPQLPVTVVNCPNCMSLCEVQGIPSTPYTCQMCATAFNVAEQMR
eukprot:TRINITY_DN2308_c12_g1_i2.p1 TRINITY_DN2308_c12_g1~~TRINITY_DN2308_c12_g1_i2.p1  ORF type:complete len:718 (+),score=281.66 TRINITY_DN2308_c12_g1_i2:144-2297(+)